MNHQPDRQAPKQELINCLEQIKKTIEAANNPAKALCKEDPSQQYISDFLDECRNCLNKVIDFLKNKDKPKIDDILSSIENQSQEIDNNHQ